LSRVSIVRAGGQFSIMNTKKIDCRIIPDRVGDRRPATTTLPRLTAPRLPPQLMAIDIAGDGKSIGSELSGPHYNPVSFGTYQPAGYCFPTHQEKQS
jgi:hypothetical protein